VDCRHLDWQERAGMQIMMIPHPGCTRSFSAEITLREAALARGEGAFIEV